MKNIFLAIWLLFNTCPDDSCDYYDLYMISSREIIKNINTPYFIDFKYKISESLKEDLNNSDLLDLKEKMIIMKELKIHNFTPCHQLINYANSINGNIKNKQHLNQIRKLNYSKPIYISNNRVYLFLTNLIIEKNRGVKGGANIMQIWERKEHSWYLKETKILEFY